MIEFLKMDLIIQIVCHAAIFFSYFIVIPLIDKFLS